MMVLLFTGTKKKKKNGHTHNKGTQSGKTRT